MPTILDLAIEDFDKQIADLQRKRALIVRRRDNPDAEYIPVVLTYMHKQHEFKGLWQAQLWEDYTYPLLFGFTRRKRNEYIPCSPTFNIPRVPEDTFLMTLL